MDFKSSYPRLGDSLTLYDSKTSLLQKLQTEDHNMQWEMVPVCFNQEVPLSWESAI